jgi:hypothetical protein
LDVLFLHGRSLGRFKVTPRPGSTIERTKMQLDPPFVFLLGGHARETTCSIFLLRHSVAYLISYSCLTLQFSAVRQQSDCSRIEVNVC